MIYRLFQFLWVNFHSYSIEVQQIFLATWLDKKTTLNVYKEAPGNQKCNIGKIMFEDDT